MLLECFFFFFFVIFLFLFFPYVMPRLKLQKEEKWKGGGDFNSDPDEKVFLVISPPTQKNQGILSIRLKVEKAMTWCVN